MAMAAESGLLLRDLQRQCDALLAAPGVVLTTEIAALDVDSVPRHSEELHVTTALERLQWTSATLAGRSFYALAQLLLSWPRMPLDCASRRLRTWLSAHLLAGALHELSSRESAQRQLLDTAALDDVLALTLDTSFAVQHDVALQHHALCAASDSGAETSALAFFSFKPLQPSKPAGPVSAESVLLDRVAAQWRRVLALVSSVHTGVALLRTRIQRHVARELTLPTHTTTKAPVHFLQLVKSLSPLQLGVSSARASATFARNLLDDASIAASRVPFTRRLADAALLLKSVQPLLQKPTKAAVRIDAFALAATVLKRELLAVDANTMALVYATAHVSEWTSCLCELHALALKSVAKKRDLVAVAWDLRTAVLCWLPNDVFSRYWRDDVHTLLRLRCQQNKDSASSSRVAATTLDCLSLCFVQMLQRHFGLERAVPTERECMETINTAQAWCFFSLHKHKSLHAFTTHTLPALVRISVGIAAYNMVYAVQSHVRRLLLEAESIFDEKKLIGLESLLAIYRHCDGQEDGTNTCRGQKELAVATGALLTLDHKALDANTRALGEFVGHILIECNTNLGHELLLTDMIGDPSATLPGGNAAGALAQPTASTTLSSRLLRDEFKRALAVHTYAAALCSLEFLSSALELSDDQTMLLVARASIHADSHVRACASRALHCIVTNRRRRQVAGVFRGLTDFLLRMTCNLASGGSDVDACVILTKLLGSLVRASGETFAADATSCWETAKARDESLVQVDAVCVYLLATDNETLRGCILDTLEAVRTAADGRSTVADTKAVTPSLRLTVSEASTAQLCVLDVIRTMEDELQRRFFTIQPPHDAPCSSPSAGTRAIHHQGTAGVPFFRYLATDAQHPRRSFRWSTCLSLFFARLSRDLPEVTVYIWSDVNDKIVKVEPMIATSVSESESSASVARWRNLSLLATVSASTRFAGKAMLTAGAPLPLRDGVFRNEAHESLASSANGSVQSVISASAVASLLKRLARYLRSPSMEQRKAAVLALGNTNPSFLNVLVDVLQKYEAEAFGLASSESASRSHETTAAASHSSGSSALSASPAQPLGGIWKQSRLGRVKLPTRSCGSVQLRWALGRCYRLLLEQLQRRVQHGTHASGEQSSVAPPARLNRFLRAAGGFLAKMSTANEKHGQSQSQGAIGFMMEQDFCSSIRILLRFHSEQPLDAATAARPELKVFSRSDREKLFYLVLSWCEPVGALAVPTLAQHLDWTGFIASASPFRKTWVQCCDVFGDCVDGELVIPSLWFDDDDLTALVASASEAASSSRNSTSLLVAQLQRYFLCQAAFAAMVALVECGPNSSSSTRSTSVIFSPPLSSDTLAFRWLDECFCVDSQSLREADARTEPLEEATHFRVLQQIGSQALRALLAQDFDTFGPICVDKALFAHAHGDKFVLAKHYFGVLCDERTRVKYLWKSSRGSAENAADDRSTTSASGSDDGEKPDAQLLVQLLHVVVLHAGVEGDTAHRVRALSFLKRLVVVSATNSSSKELLVNALAQLHGTSSRGFKTLPVMTTQATIRSQVALSSLLATHFPSLAVRMTLTALRFIAYCDTALQRKRFAAVLPWLAEVDISALQAASGDAEEDVAQLLLTILFRLTKSLSASCSSELEQTWQTLAFASHSGSAAETCDDRALSTENLGAVVEFVFFQRGSAVQLATSQTIVWWLCRWHDAALHTITELLDIAATQRHRHALVLPVGRTLLPTGSSDLQERSTTTSRLGTLRVDTSPLDDAAVIVTLLADSSCTLQFTQVHDPAAVSDVALQVVHLALLTLFGSLRSSTGTQDPTTSYFDDAEADILYDGIANDSLLVLRNLLPLLHASNDSICRLVDQLAALVQDTGEVGTLVERNRSNSDGDTTIHRRAKLAAFGDCLARFSHSSLQSSELVLWSDACVKEFALAIARFNGSTAASASQQTSLLQPAHAMGKAKGHTMLCLRFALVMHRSLAALFAGDVFLTLMELLHHSLDEQNRDPIAAHDLVRECLYSLQAMVALMPASQLVLYPQILWVCVALLHHSQTTTASQHRAVADLFFEVLATPHFFTSVVLQDVLLCKRPQLWSKAQSSVLRAIGLNVFHSLINDASGETKTPDRAFEMLTLAVILPCPVLLADEREHATLCTIAQLPYLSREAAVCREAKPSERLAQIATDLRNLWSDIDGDDARQLCDYFDTYMDEWRSLSATAIDECRLLEAFASKFVALLSSWHTVDPSFDGVSVCFEVLVAAADCGQARPGRNAVRGSGRLDLASAALQLLLELLKALERCGLAWTMSASLVATLTRLVREPCDDEQQWSVSVGIVGYLDTPGSLNGAVPSSIAQDSVRLTSTSKLAISTGAANAPGAVATSAKAETPTSIKKESLQTARKFISLMTGRSGSPSSKASASSNHHESNQSNSSSSTSSSFIVGSHPGVDVALDPAAASALPASQCGTEKLGGRADPNDDDNDDDDDGVHTQPVPPPPTPTRRKLFR